jgi:two-component system chemotaxis response regulator CheY
MIHINDEMAQEYLAECLEHLVNVETDLHVIDEGGAEADQELVNRAFREVHWVKAGASLFNLTTIGGLAHQTEDVLALIRSRHLLPTQAVVGVLLRATDALCSLVQNAGTSNQADIAELTGALAGLCADHAAADGSAPGRPGHKHLRALLAEDDFSSRLMLQSFLSGYGECHVAVNGREAVAAFRSALERGQRYDLICMDIMMPEMDGREAVRQIRALEQQHGILSTSGAKIIMTTALDDLKEVARCFHELCDSYLTKPVDLSTLLAQMKSYQLVH